MADKAGASASGDPVAEAPKRGRRGAPAKPSNGPSDDDVLVYIKGLREIDDKIDALRKTRNDHRAAARGQGIKLQVMDRRLAMQLWDPDDIRAEDDAFRRYGELLGQPVGRQLELFGDPATPDAIREQVRWQAIGRSHGLAGRGGPEEPPEGCPPECRQPYGAGWTAGQGETQQAFLRSQKVKGTA